MHRLLLHEARVARRPGPRRCATSVTRSCSTIRPTRSRSGTASKGCAGRSSPSAFDRRLTETLVLFASPGPAPAHLGVARSTMRRPTLPPGSSPTASTTSGAGEVMVLVDPATAGGAAGRSTRRTGVTRRASGRPAGRGRRDRRRPMRRGPARRLRGAMPSDRRRSRPRPPRVAPATPGSPTTSCAWTAGRPAVARRATFDGLSYLSSIGTAGWARGSRASAAW